MTNHIDVKRIGATVTWAGGGGIRLQQMIKEKQCSGMNFLMPFLPFSVFCLKHKNSFHLSWSFLQGQNKPRSVSTSNSPKVTRSPGDWGE